MSPCSGVATPLARTPSEREPYGIVLALPVEASRIGLERDVRIFVPENACDRDRIKSGVDHARGCGVPEIVERETFRQTGDVASGFIAPARHVPVSERLAVPGREDRV